MDVPAPGEEIEEFDYEFARQITAQALRNLPEDRRRLISLAYVEGMSRLSLAEQFGVPVGTIKTWLRRAIASVREECLASGRAPLLQTAAG
jgi:RNA polymerase sigma-70 factor (ECF subfamily)